MEVSRAVEEFVLQRLGINGACQPLVHGEGNFSERFLAALSTSSHWSIPKVEEWKERLANYLNNDSQDLTVDQWEALRESLAKFHIEVLAKCGGEVGDMPSKDYAERAIAAIRTFKNAKCRINDVFSELCFDDPETEAKRILSQIVNNVVLLVEGGRPFERVEVDWVDPTTDRDFNKGLYQYASAEQMLPDAEPIPWLRPSGDDSMSLPRDLLKRLTTPPKCGEPDDHEDWEYSVTHLLAEEEEYARFEPTFDILRKGLKDILIEEIQNDSSNVNTTASIDPDVVAVAAKKLESGEIDVDFKPMFILPFEVNHSKLVGVRDENVGQLVSYKEVVKPPFERIVDKNLRKDPKAWTDPERPAGPQIRTYGWEPLEEVGEDGPTEESDIVKKKENPDAFGAGSAVTESDIARMEKLVGELKSRVLQRIETKAYGDQTVDSPAIKDYLEWKGQRFGIVLENFDSPQAFLKSLDLPEMRGKDSERACPLDNEVIPLDPEWVGLDGSGGPHEPLVEENYWKQLEAIKKPPQSQTVDWKAVLSQELEGSHDPEDEELRKYLVKITESQTKPKPVAKPDNMQKAAKDHPAKKRQLDREFTDQWIERFGSTDGIQGVDPRSFKPPEHLVSSEEYEEKFLTHPFTSSYVFHPNFVRFRRTAKDHPLYAEHAFEKLASPASFDPARNLAEFKSVAEELDTSGPQVTNGATNLINEKHLGVDVDEARIWDSEFSTYMVEKLSLLEGFADRSRKAFKKPDEPCQEEDSDSLLYATVAQRETPKDRTVEFLLQPFTLEDFANLPTTTDVADRPEPPRKTEAPDSSASDDSDSDEEGSTPANPPLSGTVQWRPVKNFSGYEKLNVLQMLSDAATLVETTIPKKFQPPPRIMEWIQGKYQPSTNRLKNWRKQYGALFPEINSPLDTPFLFMSEEQRLAKLNKMKPAKEEIEEPDNPWTLTAEEKSAMKNASLKANDDVEEETKESAVDSERINNLERRAGIGRMKRPGTDDWVEELDTSEAPDMTTIGELAREFPFELDNFQKQAILALENGYNVFVSAHTSAGKTVVAEYAIAMSQKRRSRAIYTSPIKALSNQKYNDFKKVFDSVGLITGDVQLNDSADCLIMTTEILRSMLYNSSEGIRDLEFVILDEVHYFNDPERGHVWEEVLILLPVNVQIVMLSATVPNYMEFANWVGERKNRKVMVCKTLKRPVPLKHYFYVDVSKIKSMKPSSGRFLLKDGDDPINKSEWEEIRRLIYTVDKMEKEERKKIRMRLEEKKVVPERQGKSGFSKFTLSDMESMEAFDVKSGPNKQDLMSYYQKKEKKHWIYFINFLKDEGCMPTIVFAFSRKKCDELADLLDSPLLSDMTTEEDKWYIRGFIKAQIRKLDDVDKDLPQIKKLSRHLEKGIGVHHSGILPVLKEIVEILFQEGRVKLLIATETFAMGVNMPARTVVFYSINKFDGSEQRHLKPSEYIQMAGRAGRRGDDTEGNVIIKCQSKDASLVVQGKLTISDIEAMMTSSPDKLQSQFRVKYRMLLSTLTAGSKITAMDMMQLSFFENKDQKTFLKKKEFLDEVNRSLEQVTQLVHSKYHSDVIKRYSDLYDAADDYLTKLAKLREAQSQSGKFMKEVAPGKYVKFSLGQAVNKIGLIVTARSEPVKYTVLALRDTATEGALLEKPQEVHMEESERWFRFLAVLAPPEVKQSLNGEFDARLAAYEIYPVNIVEVYKDSLSLTEDKAAMLIRKANIASYGGRAKSDVDLLEISYKLHSSKTLKPFDDAVFARESASDSDLYEKLKLAEWEMKRLAVEVFDKDDRANFIKTFAPIFNWKEIQRKSNALHQRMTPAQLSLFPEYCMKKEILEDFKYVVDDRVQMKGYMAARISKYELLLTEMLVRNVLKDLTPEEVAGLMAFIVFQTRGSSPKKEVDDETDEYELYNAPTDKLLVAIKDTIKIINELDYAEAQRGLNSDELPSLRDAFGLTPIMYRWAKQESFAEIMRFVADFQEGMLVRWIQQLVEALKEIESAARVMGNNDLPKKIQDSIKSIKRGIVFSPSLYTTL